MQSKLHNKENHTKVKSFHFEDEKTECRKEKMHLKESLVFILSLESSKDLVLNPVVFPHISKLAMNKMPYLMRKNAERVALKMQ